MRVLAAKHPKVNKQLLRREGGTVGGLEHMVGYTEATPILYGGYFD